MSDCNQGLLRNASVNCDNETFSQTGNISDGEKTTAVLYREPMVLYIIPIILGIGLVGNVISCSVMMSRRMRNMSTSVYLTALSLGDLASITWAGVDWVFYGALNNQTWTRNNVACKLELELLYRNVVFSYSAWIVVAVSLERLVVTCFPLRATKLCTSGNAIKVSIGVLGLTLIMELGIVVYLWSIYGFCNHSAYQFCYKNKVVIWLGISFYNFLPTTIIIISAFVIITKLKLNSAIAHKLSSNYSNRKRGKNGKATMVVLVVALTHFVLALPGCIIFGLVRMSYHEWVTSPALRTVFSVGYASVMLNHGINLFLYVITSERFRKQIPYACAGKRKRQEVVNKAVLKTSIYYARGVSPRLHRLARRGALIPD